MSIQPPTIPSATSAFKKLASYSTPQSQQPAAEKPQVKLKDLVQALQLQELTEQEKKDIKVGKNALNLVSQPTQNEEFTPQERADIQKAQNVFRQVKRFRII